MDTKKLRQKILDLAIHGKLVPQDPNDEPASVLLERIRAEKERLISEGKIKRSRKTVKTADMHHYEQDVPFEVPKGWVWCTLDDICLISGRIGFRGYTKEDLVEQGKGAITLSPSNIIDGCMNYDKCTYISWSKYEESPEIKVNNYDILLVKTGSSFGKCALVTELPLQATINPQFVVLKRVTIHRSYLTYALQSQYAHKIYDEFVLGTAIPTFTQVALGNMEIPIPPFTEQQRIVEEVERWFKLIDIIEQGKADLQTTIKQAKNKILELAIHGKLVPQDPNDKPASELLKRINPKAEITCDNEHSRKLPYNWSCISHNSIIELSGGSQPPKRKFINKPTKGYIRLFQIRDYGKNPLPVYIPNVDAVKQTHKGDILLARYGGSLGKVFIAENGAYNVAMTKVIFKQPQLIDKMFAFFYYHSRVYQDKLKEISRTAQAGFNSGDFEDLYFPLPPLAEQKRIVRKIEDLFTLINIIEMELAE